MTRPRSLLTTGTVHLWGLQGPGKACQHHGGQQLWRKPLATDWSRNTTSFFGFGQSWRHLWLPSCQFCWDSFQSCCEESSDFLKTDVKFVNTLLFQYDVFSKLLVVYCLIIVFIVSYYLNYAAHPSSTFGGPGKLAGHVSQSAHVRQSLHTLHRELWAATPSSFIFTPGFMDLHLVPMKLTFSHSVGNVCCKVKKVTIFKMMEDIFFFVKF